MIRSVLLFFTLCFSTWAVAQCPDSTVVIYLNDFESGPGGLMAGGYPSWEHGVITNNWTGTNCSSLAVQPPGASSGTQGWGTVLNTCYDNSGDTSSVQLTVDLSDPGLTSASLQFRSYFDVFTNFDYIFILVNGTQVYLNNSTTNSGGWVTQTVDLTPFLGNQAVNITFHLFATIVVNRAGWYLDDMEVTGCVPGLTTSVQSIDDAERSRIWPNPSNGSVNVYPATAQGEVENWRLLDSHGREVRRGGMLPVGAVSVLDLQGRRGLYVLEMTSAGNAWRERIVLH